MDGAANKVKKLATRILPQEPHHLAIDPHDKYPASSNFWQHGSRLHYTTFISDADRGVLLTRPYYDILEESSNPAMSSSSTRPGSAAGERKKKISLADYQTSKLKKSSQSPPHSGPVSGTSQQNEPKSTAAPTANSRDPKGQTQDRKATSGKATSSNSDGRPSSTLNGERCGDPVAIPPTKPPGSTLLDNRKRNLDPEDSTRSQKRVKSNSISKPELSRMSQSDGQSRREEKGAYHDKAPGREIKSAEVAATANGRLNQGVRKEGEKATATPRPPPNGVKVHAPTAANNRQATPKKGEGGSTKASLPPLLSPLRLELGADPESVAKTNKNRPADSSSGHLKPPPKVQKTDGTATNKQKSPLQLPPLLSPTLPPIVEQELARIKKTPSKGELSQPSSQGSDHLSSAKKSRPTEDIDDDSHSRAPTKPSLMVTIKYKKKDAKSVQRLLALKPRPRVEEKSEAAEDVPSPARKRPAPSGAPQESIAAKRPKLLAEKTIAASRPAAPSTPLKTTAMSRAASSNSLARTPGEATSTPSDRPNTGTGDRDRDRERDRERDSAAAFHRGLVDRFQKLGTKLKHDRDAVLRSGPRLANGAVRQDAARVPSSVDRDNRKLIAILSLEMLMAFVIAFGNLDQARELERKAYDPQVWESLLPHLAELRGHTKGLKPLEVMVLQFQAQIYEQVNRALLTQEQTSKIASKLAHFNKKRNEAWVDAHRALQQVGADASSMTTTIGPWNTIDATVRAHFPNLRRWCHKNQVAWEEQVELLPSAVS